MKTTALVLPAAALAAGIVLAAQPAATGAAGAPKAKLAQITVNAPLPKEVPFDAKPFGWDANAGYALTYVVKGTGLAEIDGASLKIDTATVGGASIATTAAGKPAWHVGRSPSPRVAAGGEWGSFTVEIAPEGGVKNALPTIHGSIDVVCSTGVSEKSAPLAVAPGTTVSLGGLSFKSSKAQNFFGGGESFGIDVAGDLTKLASIEIVDGGKTVKSNGRMQMAAVTYLFPTPSSDTVTLKVSVREGNSRHTVKF